MNDALERLLYLIKQQEGIGDKARLATIIADAFELTQNRSVFFCADFAIRFSRASSSSFSNTVLSLSNLMKYDDRPFIVCVVTPTHNHCLLANTTFLKKISHSSQALREDHIRGSFNGSDIAREFDGIANSPDHFERLFAIHAEVGFEGNLSRLVEATNNISPSGHRFHVTSDSETQILRAPTRALSFVLSQDYDLLKRELDERVLAVEHEIFLASLIENRNLRGRVIEYLIAGENNALREQIILSLRSGDYRIPPLKTDNMLGDYHRDFDQYHTETDIKTKVMILNSNPKAYNIDKMLEFLTSERSVFMFYFIGIDFTGGMMTALLSMFQNDLMQSTILLRHWAGRNSRGVTQIEGKTLQSLIPHPNNRIDDEMAQNFLRKLIDL